MSVGNELEQFAEEVKKAERQFSGEVSTYTRLNAAETDDGDDVVTGEEKRIIIEY